MMLHPVHARAARALLVAGLLTVGAVPAVRAASNDSARIVLHVVSATAKNTCGSSQARPSCVGIVTSGALAPSAYFVYLLVTNADPVKGIAGVECGISYNGALEQGVDVYGWHNCGGVELPSAGWPESGGGNIVTWTAGTQCQRSEPGGAGTGVVATAGYFYMAAYSPDQMQVTTHPLDGIAKVADCSSAESVIEGDGVHHVPSRLGFASFSAGGATAGYNPCDPGSLLDCTISGANPAYARTSGVTYSADAAPANATFQWTVYGGGTSISGPSTGRSVALDIGSGSSFTLVVTVTIAGFGSRTCSAVYPILSVPCAIVGPASVWFGDQATYSVSTNIPDASFFWSAGGSTIVGSATSNVVTVRATSHSTIPLGVTISAPSGASSCSRSITVNEPPCSISGPSQMLYGAEATFTAATDLVSPTYHWLLNGPAVIVGAEDGSSVTVHASAAGEFFTLGVEMNAGGPTAACQKYVGLRGPNVCGISGPNSVNEGALGASYSFSGPGPIASATWSISGNGTITTDIHATTVSVNAGSSGSFLLEVTYTSTVDPNPATCQKSVTVNPPACAIGGPVSVPAYSTSATFNSGLPVAGATYAWSMTGNGIIRGSTTNSAVTVDVGGAGGLTMHLTITTEATTKVCSRDVTVTPVSGVHPQAGARLLLHLTTPTAKNSCAGGTPSTCAAARTNGSLYPATYFAYLLVGNANAPAGIAGLQCGLDYNGAAHSGVDIYSWTRCSGNEYPSDGWPASGGGNLIVWDGASSCQRSEPAGAGTGVVAPAGYFYLAAYSTDLLRIIPRPSDGIAKVVDCSGNEDIIGGISFPTGQPSQLGSAYFTPGGAAPGSNPCTQSSAVPDVGPGSRPWLTLEANRPNPFYSSTEVSWRQDRPGLVQVAVHDLQGRLVVTLSNRDETAGAHDITWDGRGADGRLVGAGLYVLRVQSGDQTQTQKLIRVR